MGGIVLIAELFWSERLQGQLSIRLVAFCSYTACTMLPGRTQVAAALEHRSVRLMAGEFGDTLLPLLATIRKRMTITVCAMITDKEDGAIAMRPSESGGPSGAVKVAPSAMLLAGPVGRLTIGGPT